MEYIVVIGGNMSNKGAQSMVFQIVDEMHNRYPEKKVVVFMTCKGNDAQTYDKVYNFDIVPFSAKDILALYGGVQAVAANIMGVSKHNIDSLKRILNHTFIAFDVSGYSFSSNWRATNSVKYLYRISIMQKYKIPTIIMPQSFGPFEYNIIFKTYINWLGKRILQYPKLIFAREDFSYHILKNQFKLKNVCLSKDMVLLGKNVDKSCVLNKDIKLKEFSIEKGSIAVVPNEKLAEKFSTEQAVNIYKVAIDSLIQNNKKIYIVQHSEADINLCIRIKKKYQEIHQVTLIQENLNCLEYDFLIKQFEFIIASRYHSLVHAFKQNVPCIAIGWSEKYVSLMETLHQEEYIIDASNFDREDFLIKLTKMQANHHDERKRIWTCLNNINTDIYKQIFGSL